MSGSKQKYLLGKAVDNKDLKDIDVRLGRGTFKNIGNTKYNKRARELYNQEKLFWKDIIGESSEQVADTLIKEMRGNGARFLHREEKGGCWYELIVDNDTVFKAEVCKKITDIRNKDLKNDVKEEFLPQEVQQEVERIINSKEIPEELSHDVLLTGINFDRKKHLLGKLLQQHKDKIIDIMNNIAVAGRFAQPFNPTHFIAGKRSDGQCIVLANEFFFLHDDGNVDRIEKDKYTALTTPDCYTMYLPQQVVAAWKVAYRPGSNNSETILFDTCPMILNRNQFARSRRSVFK